MIKEYKITNAAGTLSTFLVDWYAVTHIVFDDSSFYMSIFDTTQTFSMHAGDNRKVAEELYADFKQYGGFTDILRVC